MRIGLTYDLKGDREIKEDDPQDVNAELDKEVTIDNVVTAIESGGHEVVRIGNVARLLKVIDTLDVDIVFNFCEGYAGRNRESEVPVLLEMKGIPFVGADGLTLGLTLDKVMAKKVFIAENIPTPRFFVADENDDLEALNTIGFPLIVKTRHEGSSKGLSEDSLVRDLDALRKRVIFVNNTYDQSAIVEEFIPGTEFTVAVLGNDEPEAMPVVQTTIEGAKDLDNKIYTNRRIYDGTVQYLCPAPISEEMTEIIKELAVRVFKAVECRDFGRVDFRVDKKGNPYVLEINPLPSMDVEDVFHLFPQQLGADFNATINLILNFALKRYGLIEEVPNVFFKQEEAHR